MYALLREVFIQGPQVVKISIPVKHFLNHQITEAVEDYSWSPQNQLSRTPFITLSWPFY